ncbi:hypothetical protein JNW90_32260 [Micromonospora sp. STR1s_5]|nr:hypothetical protein [Micromonospora sp. STR1s_5]MBM0207152.1 hypothetical protein [Micromonospora sp. STR1s_5]
MKQQQAQVQGTDAAFTGFDIEAVAIRNFEAKNVRGDRAWSRDRMDPGRPALVLSERERSEFIEQAHYQTQQAKGQAKIRPSLH